MHIKNIERLDLSLFNVFIALHQTCNTVQAAEKLDMSQPAVSRALTKLRNAFNDQLFIRSQRGMQPTVVADKLAKALPEAMENLLLACKTDDKFEPTLLEGEIRLAMHPQILNLIARDLYKKIADSAPQLSLRLDNWDQLTSSQIIEGSIDIGINYELGLISKEIYVQSILQDSTCFLASPSHPLQGHKTTLSKLAEYELCNCIIPEFNQNMSMLQSLERAENLKFNVPLRCAQLSTLVELLNTSDMILAGMSLYAAIYPDKLKIIDCDIPYFQSTPLSLFYSIRNRHSPKYHWLNNTISNIIEEKVNVAGSYN